MGDPLSDVQTVAGLWRPLSAAEQLVGTNLIEVASDIIRARYPLIQDWLDEGLVSDAVVSYVVTQMIISAVDQVNRPRDAKSVSKTAGVFTESITYGAASYLTLEDSLAGLLVPVSVMPTYTPVRSIRQAYPRVPVPPYCGPNEFWR